MFFFLIVYEETERRTQKDPILSISKLEIKERNIRIGVHWWRGKNQAQTVCFTNIDPNIE